MVAGGYLHESIIVQPPKQQVDSALIASRFIPQVEYDDQTVAFQHAMSYTEYEYVYVLNSLSQVRCCFSATGRTPPPDHFREYTGISHRGAEPIFSNKKNKSYNYNKLLFKNLHYGTTFVVFYHNALNKHNFSIEENNLNFNLFLIIRLKKWVKV